VRAVDGQRLFPRDLMVRRTFASVVVGVLSLAVGMGRAHAQTDPYAKLIGTWAVDSMNGVDDNGLPKTQTIAFSRSGSVLHVTLTTDDGNGPTTLVVDCSAAAVGATRDLCSGQSARCTLHPSADSIMYTLVVRKSGEIIASERGRLVVSQSGTRLRDDYDATRAKLVLSPSGATLLGDYDTTGGSGQLGHHRHVYSKKP
jgi:hypothetical protein